MRCDDVLARLHDDSDSGLSAADRAEIDRHLAECPTCRAAAEEWQAVRERIDALPVDIAPIGDLWPAIAQGIEEHAPARSGKTFLGARWLQAAAAVTLVAVTGLFVLWGRSSETPRPTTVAQSEGGTGDTAGISAPAISASSAADLARYEDRTLETRRDLLVAVAQQEARLGGALTAEVASDVQSLNQAIGEIRLALRKSPENPRLTLLLAAKFQQEADLLKRLSHI